MLAAASTSSSTAKKPLSGAGVRDGYRRSWAGMGKRMLWKSCVSTGSGFEVLDYVMEGILRDAKSGKALASRGGRNPGNADAVHRFVGVAGMSLADPHD